MVQCCPMCGATVYLNTPMKRATPARWLAVQKMVSDRNLQRFNSAAGNCAIAGARRMIFRSKAELRSVCGMPLQPRSRSSDLIISLESDVHDPTNNALTTYLNRYVACDKANIKRYEIADHVPFGRGAMQAGQAQTALLRANSVVGVRREATTAYNCANALSEHVLTATGPDLFASGQVLQL